LIIIIILGEGYKLWSSSLRREKGNTVQISFWYIKW
jgi:hypothetical protein